MFFLLIMAGVPSKTITQGVPPLEALVTEREIAFTGTVVESAQDTLKVRDANGNLVNFGGNLTSYPFQPGDQFSLTARASLPTPFYFEHFGGQPNAEGLHSIFLQTAYYNGGGNP